MHRWAVLLAFTLLAGCLAAGPEPASEMQIPADNTIASPTSTSTPTKMNEIVILETSHGNIEIELNREKAPISTENFLTYVRERHYTGTVFHRVIDGFMIQGGGFDRQGRQKPTRGPIKLEADNGLKNAVGTVAMARTSNPDSATSQFFINLIDNDFLNRHPGSDGYAVFGKVIAGMDVVEKIKKVKTGQRGSQGDWPVEDVVIEKAYLKG